MNTVEMVIIFAIAVFRWILIGRIIVEMIASFSRNFRPPSWFAVISEPLFVITEPPIRALRRMIPPLRMGNVALDLAVLVLFLLLIVLEMVVRMVFAAV